MGGTAEQRPAVFGCDDGDCEWEEPGGERRWDGREHDERAGSGTVG